MFSIISFFREEIEYKSLPLWNKLLNMEDINRIKMVLFEKKRTARWLAGQLGVTPSTVSKWCTNGYAEREQARPKVKLYEHLKVG